MNRLALSRVLYGGIAAFLLGCTLIGTPLVWTPLTDGEWTFLFWSGTSAMVIGIACVVVAVFLTSRTAHH